MSGPVEVVVILAAVGYVLARRLMGEPAQAKRMLVLPAVLSVIGLSDVSGHVKTPVSLLFLVATAAVSVALGALRGVSVRIYRHEGVAFVRYTGVTVVLWVVSLAVRFGANLVLGAVDRTAAGAVGEGLLLTLGLGILAEGLVVLSRALRAGHPVMWAQGRDGAPPQRSPFLDELRRGRNERGYDLGGDPYGDDGAAGGNTRPGRLRGHRR
jgi:hypothetical protein